MPRRTSLSRRRALLGLLLLAVIGLGIAGWLGRHSALLHPELAARKAHYEQLSSEGRIDAQREASLAGAYWRRYPDVAQNPYFGEGGLLGVFGAREHFERAGRAEGRRWDGEPASSSAPR